MNTLQRALVLAAMPALLQIIFVICAFVVLHNAESQLTPEGHANKLAAHGGALVELLNAGETELRSRSGTGNKSDTYFPQCQRAVDQVPVELKSMRTISQGRSKEQAIIQHLQTLTSQALGLSTDVRRSLSAGDQRSATRKLSRFHSIVKDVSQDKDRLIDESKKNKDVNSAGLADYRGFVGGVLITGLLLNILLSAGLAYAFNKALVERLSLLTDNIRRLAAREPLNPELIQDFELASIDSAIRDLAADLAESERKEKAVINESMDVVCSMGADGNFTSVSPSSVKIWGYKPQELIGRKYTDLVLPEDLALHFQSMSRSFTAPIESRMRRKDGAIVHMRWSIYWSKSDQSVFCVARDVTEQKVAENLVKASESRMRTIIEHMPIGLLIVDERGIVESINPRTQELFGYTQQEVAGRPLTDLLVQPGDGTTLADVRERAMVKATEVDGRKKSGEVFSIELLVSDYQAAEGKRYLASIQDVTERHEVERLKQEFVAMVSHDLRTPLTSIQAFLNLLEAGAFGQMSEQGQKKIGVAERNISRLVQLVNDLLDIEKMEAGRLKLKMGKTRLSTVIERSVESVRGVAEQEGIAIQVPSSDVELTADADRLVQVLVNLLSNAIKFSPHGSTVSITYREQPGWLEVSVTDRGRGVPAAFRSAIFERFKQVEVSDGKRGRGTGLGLAICKAIVEGHQGTIGLESEDGKGSSFWFRIPSQPPGSPVTAG